MVREAEGDWLRDVAVAVGMDEGVDVLVEAGGK